MTKKVNEEALRSELSNSAFFRTEASSELDMQDQKRVVVPRGLSLSLDDLSERGYTSHSYRFTDEELAWLNQFCLDAGAKIGRRIYHNTLIRSLLRLADEEWSSNPEDNRLSQILRSVKE